MNESELLVTVISCLWTLVLGIGAYAYASDRKSTRAQMQALSTRMADHDERGRNHGEQLARLAEYRESVRGSLDALEKTIEKIDAKLDRLLTSFRSP